MACHAISTGKCGILAGKAGKGLEDVKSRNSICARTKVEDEFFFSPPSLHD
jgi:hypothetical protein